VKGSFISCIARDRIFFIKTGKEHLYVSYREVMSAYRMMTFCRDRGFILLTCARIACSPSDIYAYSYIYCVSRNSCTITVTLDIKTETNTHSMPEIFVKIITSCKLFVSSHLCSSELFGSISQLNFRDVYLPEIAPFLKILRSMSVLSPRAMSLSAVLNNYLIIFGRLNTKAQSHFNLECHDLR